MGSFTIDNEPISGGKVYGSLSIGTYTTANTQQLVSPEVKEWQEQIVSAVTEEFTYEKARRYKYKVFSSNEEASRGWDVDLAAGAISTSKGWLTDLGDIEYYEISSIRQNTTYPYSIIESSSTIKVGFSGPNYIDSSQFQFIPLRLNFSIADPDSSTNCYRIYRKNKLSTNLISIGYHCPDSNIQFGYSGGDSISLSGLDDESHYRLSWHCYSGSKISFNGSTLKNTKPATSEGLTLRGKNFPNIGLVKDPISDFHGVDLWLERKINRDYPASMCLWSFVASAEIFHYDNNYYCENCSFLDCFDKNLVNLSL